MPLVYQDKLLNFMKKVNKFYDIAIVGSGPTACLSAIALRENLKKKIKVKVALITGESNNLTNNCIHPNFINSLKKNIFEKFNFTQNIKFNLVSTGIVGGLANFWGGQLERFCKNDNFIKNFKSFKEYNFYCDKVLEIIKVTEKKKYKKKRRVVDNYQFNNPNIYKNNKIFSKIITNLIKEKFLEKKKERVCKVLFENNYFRLYFEKNKYIYAKKIILASGVLSNSKILLNSTKASHSFFRDHYPHFLYFFDYKNYFKNLTKYKNYLSFKKNKKDKTILFGSLYDLGKFNLNELFFFLFNKELFFFKKIKLGILSRYLRPIQFWTNKMLIQFSMDKNFKLSKKINYNYKNDSEYIKFANILKKNLIIILRGCSFLGFHYHNLNFVMNKKIYNINNFLKKIYNKNIICDDPLPIINPLCLFLLFYHLAVL
jgi:hypothetical protein